MGGPGEFAYRKEWTFERDINLYDLAWLRSASTKHVKELIVYIASFASEHPWDRWRGIPQTTWESCWIHEGLDDLETCPSLVQALVDKSHQGRRQVYAEEKNTFYEIMERYGGCFSKNGDIDKERQFRAFMCRLRHDVAQKRHSTGSLRSWELGSTLGDPRDAMDMIKHGMFDVLAYILKDKPAFLSKTFTLAQKLAERHTNESDIRRGLFMLFEAGYRPAPPRPWRSNRDRTLYFWWLIRTAVRTIAIYEYWCRRTFAPSAAEEIANKEEMYDTVPSCTGDTQVGVCRRHDTALFEEEMNDILLSGKRRLVDEDGVPPKRTRAATFDPEVDFADSDDEAE